MSEGLNVLAEHKGFTQSHVILIDITKQGDGGTIEETLEKANIIINRNLLPWDIKEGRHFMHPGGIRLRSFRSHETRNERARNGRGS